MRRKKDPIPLKSLKVRAYTTPAGYQQVDALLTDLQRLSNDYLAYRRSAWHDYGVKDWNQELGDNPGHVGLHQQNRFFMNRKALQPHWNNILRPIFDNALLRVDDAFSAYFDRVKAGQTPGYPRFKSRSRYNTLGIRLFRTSWLQFDPKKKWAELHVKGLPPIRFEHHGLLPQDTLPISFNLTRRGRRLYLTLALPITKSQPKPIRQAVGLDRGINKLIALSTGEALPGINRPVPKNCPPAPPQFHIDLTPEKQRQKRLSRKMNRQRNAAVKDGRAYWQFKGLSKKTGEPKYKLIWNTGRPGKNYLETCRQNARSWERETLKVNQLLHRVTTDLIKRFDMIGVEDLHLTNMTSSAAGTLENPGKGVSAKSSLNREILGQRLGELQRQLTYKAAWAGKQVIAVPAPHTSQTCFNCEFADPGSRQGSQFRCRRCGWTDDADTNAAKNILRQAVNAALAGQNTTEAKGSLLTSVSGPAAPHEGSQAALNLLYAYGQAGAPKSNFLNYPTPFSNIS